MAEPLPCWLSIIGIGEDGLSGLAPAARAALDAADSVFGGSRHLELGGVAAKGRHWPVPFSLEPLLALRGQRVAALVSGDPFWFGAGSLLANRLPAEEWRAFPAPSCFALAASRLGWALEDVTCLGLHARPFESLRPHLAAGARLFCLVADGKAPARLAAFLSGAGFGASAITVLERLGGPHERIRTCRADEISLDDIAAPVMVAAELQGGPGLPAVPGLPDELFAHDGQITKAPIRAVTLSALGPRRGELLWDIGAGSGSIAVEWCRAGGQAFAIEAKPARAANIRENISRFGLSEQLRVIEGMAPAALDGLAEPDAIFIGGGADAAVLEAVLAMPARLVVNAVTLETEALLMAAAARHGGALMRFDYQLATSLGQLTGWQPARPILQWRLTR